MRQVSKTSDGCGPIPQIRAMREDLPSKEELQVMIKNSGSLRKVARELKVSHSVLHHRLTKFNNDKRLRKPFSELSGISNIRKRLFEERERKCELCGWCEPNPFTGLVPVQIHHKDGDRTNSDESNFQILCPNCHSLTENFMFFGRSHKDNYGEKGTVRLRTKIIL